VERQTPREPFLSWAKVSGLGEARPPLPPDEGVRDSAICSAQRGISVVKSVFLRSASQLDNFTASGKQHYASHSNEQAVLYHAGHVAQLSG